MNKNNNFCSSFENLLNSLIEGEIYNQLPPRGTFDNDIAFISNEELDALDQDVYGEEKRNDINNKKNSHTIDIKVIENLKRINIQIPEINQLNGIDIIGISGDNSRIITPSFHLILARSAIVDFKYTKGYEKPYFYTKTRDISSVFIIDNNIFKDGYKAYTNNDLALENNRIALLNHIRNFNGKPFRFAYKYDRIKSSPAAHSLGLGVKLQHTLELNTIEDIDFENKQTVVCIKDGPYISNSMVPSDIQEGLQNLLSWSKKNRFFVSVSNKIGDSKVFINTIKNGNEYLIEEYFKGQGITSSIIESFGTDVLLLRKILMPGYRTPLIQYIENTRMSYFADNIMKELIPLTCYYQKRTKPYNYLRIEIPFFMWKESEEMANFAISVAIWQYELGGDAPLVLKVANQRANLSHEQYIIEQQMRAVFEKKELNIIDFIV